MCAIKTLLWRSGFCGDEMQVASLVWDQQSKPGGESQGFLNPIKGNQWVVFIAAWSLSEFCGPTAENPWAGPISPAETKPSLSQNPNVLHGSKQGQCNAFDSPGDQGFPLEMEIQAEYLSFLSHTRLLLILMLSMPALPALEVGEGSPAGMLFRNRPRVQQARCLYLRLS